MYLHNHCFYIEITMPKLKISSENQLKLLFIERYTTKKKEFSLSVFNKSESILQACLTEMDLEELLFEGKDWDVYVSFLADDGHERKRLNSNFMDLELLFFLKDSKMLTPFTTKKGNISFKSQAAGLITKVKHIDFIHKQSIVLKGDMINPLWPDWPGDLQSTLVFSTSDNEDIVKIPLKTEKHHFEPKKARNRNAIFLPIGYEAIIPLETLLSIESEPISLKARIELSYFNGNHKVTFETPPIKLTTSGFTKKSLVKKVDGKKKRVSINKTQKSGQLNIRVDYCNVKKDIKTIIKGKLIFIKRHALVKKLYKKAFYWSGKLPANKKIVVFESFLGKQFSDNPRAIYEYLQSHSSPYKLYWSVDKNYAHNFRDKNLHCIRRFSLKWLFIMPRARFWVTNSRMPLWLPKPKQTIYLQTWHGTPLKRLAADMEEVYIPGTTAENYKKNFIKEAKNWDYLISPNAYSTEIFRRAFHFDKEVLEIGYPRNDFICNHNNEETINKLKKQYGIPLNKKVLLYAPTWRDNQFYAKGQYRFDLHLDLDLMQEKLGNDYVILFRLHYLVSENLDLTPYKGFAYDFSNLEDIRELYVMADLLLTDYSSVFFDYGNLKRPMIFYVYDIDQYRDHLRGFYFDFEQEAPGPLVKTTEEVVQTIKTLESDGFQLSPKFDLFYKKFCYLEHGESARKAVEKIFLN